MAARLRFKVVDEAFMRAPVYVEQPEERPSEYFGKYVFNKEKMYKYLPANVYKQMCDVIDNGAPFDRAIADAVAQGIKTWAIENGVTITHIGSSPLQKERLRSTMALWSTTARAEWWKSSKANSLCSKNLMQVLSPLAAFAPPSRRVAIQHGTPHRLSSSLATHS